MNIKEPVQESTLKLEGKKYMLNILFYDRGAYALMIVILQHLVIVKSSPRTVQL